MASKIISSLVPTSEAAHVVSVKHGEEAIADQFSTLGEFETAPPKKRNFEMLGQALCSPKAWWML